MFSRIAGVQEPVMCKETSVYEESYACTPGHQQQHCAAVPKFPGLKLSQRLCRLLFVFEIIHGT